MSLIDTTYRIKVPVTKKQSYRRRTVNFGDGYEQRSFDGINYLRESWDITFIGLDNTKKNNLLSILNTAGAVTPIVWIPPGETTSKQWIFNNVSMTMQSLNYYEVQVTADLVTGYVSSTPQSLYFVTDPIDGYTIFTDNLELYEDLLDGYILIP